MFHRIINKIKHLTPLLVCCLLYQLSLGQTKSNKQLPIGVFDSGTGGLTILEAMLQLDAFNNETGLPGADGKKDFSKEYFQYLADQANMPYGNYAAENKSALLIEHMYKNVDFFLSKKANVSNKQPVKLIVLACNTATAYTLEPLQNYLKQKKQPVKVIGVIEAGAKAAIDYQLSNGLGTIGVFATAGTVASNGYPITLQKIAAEKDMKKLSIVSQGGVGLAESIDRDWSYFSDTLSTARSGYKGPSLKNKQLKIDTALLKAYHFNGQKNELLCEYDTKNGSCLDMQLNDPANYVRYHLVSLMEKMRQQNIQPAMNTLILGCTHYPYMKDTIDHVLQELYNFQVNNEYVYRKFLSANVALIDPSFETAKAAYLVLNQEKLLNKNTQNTASSFYITTPNTQLKEIETQPDGWFTYQYKYGRTAGANKSYVIYQPFDTKWIANDTYLRFKKALPNVYTAIKKQVKTLM